MDRQQWLEERKKGIGGSDASSILGLNPYKTNIELWEEKTGRVAPEDIGDKPQVKYGTEAERHLRELFKLDFPQYRVEYEEFKLFKNLDYPFIMATLDGWLVEANLRGVLEIKTTEIIQGNQWAQWKDRIPDAYYIQCLHQLLATGYDFVILKAQIKSNYGGNLRLETKHYHIERSEVEADLEHLQAKEIEFWNEYVIKDIKPGLILPKI